MSLPDRPDLHVHLSIDHVLRVKVTHRADRDTRNALSQLLERSTAMSTQLDALKQNVEDENTVIDSAIALLDGLSAQIIALKDDPAALQALADEVNAKKQALADSVTKNTPAA